jgi:hypothetical protein
VKQNFILALVLSLLISLTFNLPHAISQGTLYDDFNKTTIDPTKWNSWEVVREIQQFQTVKGGPSDGKLVSKVTAYGETIRNWLNFKNPESINYIEADISINGIKDKYVSEDNHIIPRARLIGYFYNDGNPAGAPGSYLGEVQGAINIRKYKGRLEIHWGVTKYTNATGETSDTLAEGVLAVPVALKQTYRLFIQFDPTAKTFTFGVMAAAGKPLSPAVTASFTKVDDTVNPPNVPWKAIGTQVRFAPLASSLSGSVSALFDNVLAGTAPGDTPLSESFSSSSLDATKWDSLEYVREAPKGKLRSETRSINTGAVNGVIFKNPQKVKDFRANVTVNDFFNPHACNTRARLGGYFYNTDGLPDPARGYQGEVWVELSIGGTTTGGPLTANWSVSRNTTVAEGGGWESLGSGEFPVTINLGQTYNLFIGWDSARISFGISEYENTYSAEYPIATSIYPPNHNNKGLSTRITPPSPAPAPYEASISATFDDVIINGTGLPLDGSWLMNITGPGTKGGAIFNCFQNRFEGYGVGGGPFKIRGNYTVDSSGIVHAEYTVYDWDGVTVDDTGTFIGTIDLNLTKLNLTLVGEAIKLSGIPTPQDPVIPKDWKVTAPGGVLLDSFRIEPLVEDRFYRRVFMFRGTRYDPIDQVTNVIEGGFFLGAKNKVYGDYSLDDFDDGTPYEEEGLLSGTLTPSPAAKFALKAVSEDGRNKFTLKGIPK